MWAAEPGSFAVKQECEPFSVLVMHGSRWRDRMMTKSSKSMTNKSTSIFHKIVQKKILAGF